MYAHVNEAGEVDQTRTDPPTAMHMADGRSVSNPDPADVDRLALGGWVEAAVNEPAHDPDLQYLTGPTWTVSTEQLVNDLDDDADGEIYTVPTSATADYAVEPRPAHLAIDKAAIAADDTDAATVEYRDLNPSAPAEVTFTVNGAEVGPVALTSGRASVVVTSPNAGDTVVVSCDALPNQTVTIQVGA